MAEENRVYKDFCFRGGAWRKFDDLRIRMKLGRHELFGRAWRFFEKCFNEVTVENSEIFARRPNGEIIKITNSFFKID